MKKPIVIMIANQKGGVGKTACSIELCNAFGKKKYKVLGIDLDPQNSFSKISNADISTEKNLKAVLDVKLLPTDAIQHLKHYDIIPGSEDLAESGLYNKTNDVWLLEEALEVLKKKTDYDFIILDSAPGRSKLLEMEYIASDYIIAPTEADTEAESGLYKIQKDIIEYSRHNQSHVQFLGVFMNKYKSNSRLHRSMYDNLKKIEGDIGAKRFETTIRATVKAAEARLVKQSISEYVKDAGISEDFEKLVKEIIKRIKESEK